MSKSKRICVLHGRARSRQRGVVVLLLLLCFLISSSYVVLKALNTASAHHPGAYQQQNAEVLQRARAALLGYAAAYRELINDPPATKGPGYLPCPDRATDDADAGNPSRINPDKEGMPTSNCGGSGLKLGRFPWRYLGTGELRDASGERLWYAVSDNFRFNNGAFPLNATTAGTLCVDGDGDAACTRAGIDARDIVAVIIAPGEPVANQHRSPSPNNAGYYNLSEYVEGDNSTPADNRFTNSARGEFNDQIAMITRAELMQAVEQRVTASMYEMSRAPEQRPDKPPASWIIANGWNTIVVPAQAGTQ